MGSFTAAQKEKIASKLRFNLNERIEKLRYEQDALIKNLDSKLKYRLNLVPSKYRNIKLKHVIELEREQKVTFATLIHQLAEAKDQHSAINSSNTPDLLTSGKKDILLPSKLPNSDQSTRFTKQRPKDASKKGAKPTEGAKHHNRIISKLYKV